MKRSEKSFKAVLVMLTELTASGRLSAEQHTATNKAVCRLRHALRTRSFDKVHDAVADLAKAFGRLQEEEPGEGGKTLPISRGRGLTAAPRDRNVVNRRTETNVDYGRVLRIIRAVRGLSQKDMAKACDLDPSYLSRIESGDRKPSIELIEVVAKQFSIPTYLITLLASDQDDLKGISPFEAERLGRELLRLLTAAETELSL